MNTPRYAAAAARLLRRYLPSATAPSGDEARGLATIERAMSTRTRRRRLLASGASAAAAAAILVAGTEFVKWRESAANAAPVAINVTPSGQGASLARREGEAPLAAHASIESGQRIETPADGGASLQLSTGTSMTLAERTSFRVDSQGAAQRFTLQRGELLAHVAKLAGTQRFIIDTPDAEIEVRGTRFRLRVIEHGESCGTGARTRLDVSEGVVEVRAANGPPTRVIAGGAWPMDCSETAAGPQTSASSQSPPHDGAAGPKREIRSVVPALRPALREAEAERISGLTAQNNLFAEGIARARRGDTSGALRTYQELMTRFPNSALAENVMVERMRLLAHTAHGANEAKRYLARFPHGFAVREAENLLAEP